MTAAGRAPLTIERLRAALADRFQSWQIPDAIIEIPEMPLTSTGKIDKKALRRSITPGD